MEEMATYNLTSSHVHFSDRRIDYMIQCMRLWYLSKAQASLCKCADSPDPSLLACTKGGCRKKVRHLVLLNTSAYSFEGPKGFLCIYDKYHSLSVTYHINCIVACSLINVVFLKACVFIRS